MQPSTLRIRLFFFAVVIFSTCHQRNQYRRRSIFTFFFHLQRVVQHLSLKLEVGFRPINENGYTLVGILNTYKETSEEEDDDEEQEEEDEEEEEEDEEEDEEEEEEEEKKRTLHAVSNARNELFLFVHFGHKTLRRQFSIISAAKHLCSVVQSASKARPCK